jgi:hypothetical protein
MMEEQDQGQEASTEDNVERLVASVMTVERKFGHTLRGAQSDRLEDIRAAIETMLGAGK